MHNKVKFYNYKLWRRKKYHGHFDFARNRLLLIAGDPKILSKMMTRVKPMTKLPSLTVLCKKARFFPHFFLINLLFMVQIWSQNRNRNLSKVRTRTLTFHKSKPEPETVKKYLRFHNTAKKDSKHCLTKDRDRANCVDSYLGWAEKASLGSSRSSW